MINDLDPGYRLHCWWGTAHYHASRDEAGECITQHQPGSDAAKRRGCTCIIGHINSGCLIHSPSLSAYRGATSIPRNDEPDDRDDEWEPEVPQQLRDELASRRTRPEDGQGGDDDES
jgi:hypothetical protein